MMTDLSPPAAPSDENAVARTFRIALPANWIPLDVDPATIGTTIPALVERYVGGDPRVVKQRDEFARLLVAALEQAAATGAVFAAMYSEVVEEGLLGASLLAVLATTEPSAVRDGRVDIDVLHALLRDGVRPPDEVIDSGVVELYAGPAVRLRRRTAMTIRGRRVPSMVVQYFVPVPGRPNTVVMTFSTPVVQVEDAFDELFGAMADSLRWVW